MKFRVYDRIRLIKGSGRGSEGFVTAQTKKRPRDASRVVLSFSKERIKNTKKTGKQRFSSFSAANLRHLDSLNKVSKIYIDHQGYRRYGTDRQLLTGDIYRIVSVRRRILLSNLRDIETSKGGSIIK